jgi:hypothetical protein
MSVDDGPEQLHRAVERGTKGSERGGGDIGAIDPGAQQERTIGQVGRQDKLVVAKPRC